MIVYSFSLFLPLILKNGFGFTLELTYILLFPPYVAAVIVRSRQSTLGASKFLQAS